MKKILFLCTGNSCRSQMAEGFARARHGDSLDIYSAGLVAQGLNPLAVKAMAESGIDISDHHSKTLESLSEVEFDHVVTVCGHAHETCPAYFGPGRVLHHGFDDPPTLAQGAANDEEALTHYRRVRDEIETFIEILPSRLNP